jgi:uncharacterized protein YbjQ (UPF0145 family)
MVDAGCGIVDSHACTEVLAYGTAVRVEAIDPLKIQ